MEATEEEAEGTGGERRRDVHRQEEQNAQIVSLAVQRAVQVEIHFRLDLVVKMLGFPTIWASLHCQEKSWTNGWTRQNSLRKMLSKQLIR